MSPDQVIPNIAVGGQIEDLNVACPHCHLTQDRSQGTQQVWSLDGNPMGFVSPTGGCTEVLTYGDRKQHTSICVFAPVPCPNDPGSCGLIRLCDLGMHISTCGRVPCRCKPGLYQSLSCNRYKPIGCKFVSTQSKVAEHEEVVPMSVAQCLPPYQGV